MNKRTCSVEDCDKATCSRGYCRTHYTRWQRHRDPTVRKYQVRNHDAASKPCEIEGCNKAHLSRGMCPMHYQRWRKTGSASTLPVVRPTICSIPECEKPHYGNTYCLAHFTRNRRHGSATARLKGEVLDGKKICNHCLLDLPVSMFREGRLSECHICAKRYTHARRALLAQVETDNYSPFEIFDRDGWICALCGVGIDRSLKWPHRFSPSIDHVIPLSKGGTNTTANVQSAHLTCNISKGVRLPA